MSPDLTATSSPLRVEEALLDFDDRGSGPLADLAARIILDEAGVDAVAHQLPRT